MSNYYDPRKYNNDHVLDNMGYYMQEHFTNLYYTNDEKETLEKQEDIKEDNFDYFHDPNVYMSQYPNL